MPDSVPPPAGLINTAPGLTDTAPGIVPPGNTGPGAPVTGYDPAKATAAAAGSTGYQPKPFEVAPNQTVASQIRDIIASGSPLMQQAEANARQQMNARGLINSSQAITAGQAAVIGAAAPIAAADAATWDRAATETTKAQNQALQFGATAENTAGLQTAQLETGARQFNAGQQNAALAKAADASNAISLTAQQIQGSKDIQTIQSDVQKGIAQLQADTTLTAQDKAAQATILKTSMDNATAQAIAAVQSNTSLTIQEQQSETQKILASMNNENARIIQEMQNVAALENIKANGEINIKITQLTNDNKLLLQTSQGAQNLYNQALQSMSALMTNPNVSWEQKTYAMNNVVVSLTDGLSILSKVAGITPELESLLVFTPGPTAVGNRPGA